MTFNNLHSLVTFFIVLLRDMKNNWGWYLGFQCETWKSNTEWTLQSTYFSTWCHALVLLAKKTEYWGFHMKYCLSLYYQWFMFMRPNEKPVFDQGPQYTHEWTIVWRKKIRWTYLSTFVAHDFSLIFGRSLQGQPHVLDCYVDFKISCVVAFLATNWAQLSFSFWSMVMFSTQMTFQKIHRHEFKALDTTASFIWMMVFDMWI